MQKSTINDRFKEIRLKLNYTQQDFANKLNLKSRSHISSIESGNKNITDRIISDLCREFNVNEEFLRYGTGNMFLELSEEEELAKYVGKLINSDDNLRKDFILNILKLNDDDLDFFIKIMKKLIKE